MALSHKPHRKTEVKEKGRRTTSATDAAIICLTGPSSSAKCKFFFMASYVEKKAAAKSELIEQDLTLTRDRARTHTTRCASNNDTSDALVYSREAPCSPKSLRRLKTRLNSVYWKKEKVYGGPRYPTSLVGSNLMSFGPRNSPTHQEGLDERWPLLGGHPEPRQARDRVGEQMRVSG
jgi:hypothetical protein